MAQVEIKARHNGPYKVTGPVRVIDADGKEYDLGEQGETIALCRCGGSTTKPFCDGTHSRIGFQAAERAVWSRRRNRRTVLDRPRIPGSGQDRAPGPSPGARPSSSLLTVDDAFTHRLHLRRVRAPEPEMGTAGARDAANGTPRRGAGRPGGPPEPTAGGCACHRPGGAAGPPGEVEAPALGRLVTGSASSTGRSEAARARVARAARRGPGNREVHDHGERPRQLAAAGRSVLYVTGEESPAQVKPAPSAWAPTPPCAGDRRDRPWDRARHARVGAARRLRDRLGPDPRRGRSHRAPGSVGQVREVAGRLMENAKRDGVAVILVGHVTKEGSSPGRASSSTWWTASSASRASVSAPIAPSERSRTASAPRTRSVSSRCASRASWRWPTPIPACGRGHARAGVGSGLRHGGLEAAAGGAAGAGGAHRAGAAAANRQRRRPQPAGAVLAVLARHAARGGVERRVRVGGGGRARRGAGRGPGDSLAVASAARGVPLGDGRRPLAAYGEVGLTGELGTWRTQLPDVEAAKFGLAPVLGPVLPLDAARRGAHQGVRGRPDGLARRRAHRGLGVPGGSGGYAPGARYRTCSALRRASIVSSTVRRTVVSSEASAPPLIAAATAAMDTLSGASQRL